MTDMPAPSPKGNRKSFLGRAEFTIVASASCHLLLPHPHVSHCTESLYAIPFACGCTQVPLSWQQAMGPLVCIHKPKWEEPFEKAIKTAGISCYQLAIPMHSVTEYFRNYLQSQACWYIGL
jgi:hypothetical protein